MAITEVIAAITSRLRNKIPSKVPPVILPKANGRGQKKPVPGPAEGSSPYRKTIGKIASPALIATMESMADYDQG